MTADPRPPLPVSPLVLAAGAGHVDAARRLRDAGADPQTAGEADTALEAAAKAHQPAVVRMFLERPLRPAAVADAFIDAAVAGDAAMVALLAPHLATPRATARDAIAAVLERTPTRLSPMTIEQAALLVAHPDRPELAILGRTVGDPASFAALHTVLALKPPLDALDANHQTLLHKAVENDASGMVAVLLAAGAKPDTPGRCGDEDDGSVSPPLACASQRGSLTGLASVRALLAAHAGVDARTSLGMTPLMLAADGGDARIVAALLAGGADPAARDPAGHTALDHAAVARFNDPGATRALLTQAAARRRS